ncbi:MAG: oligosaccharide flippase family protein [Thermoprotei archaeon]
MSATDIYGETAAKHVAYSSAYVYSQSIVAAVSGFAFWFYATKITSTLFVGEISSLYLLSSLASTLLTFSLPSVMQRYIPIYEARGERGASIFVARLLLASGLVISAAVFAFLYFFSYPLSFYFLKNQAQAYILRYFAISVFFGLLSAFFSGLLVAHQRFKLYSSMNSVYFACYYVLALIALWKTRALLGVIAAWTVTNLTFATAFLFLSLPYVKGKAEKVEVKPMIRYGIPLYASSLVSYGSGLIDRYVVLFLSTLSLLGIYNIAISSSGVVTSLISAALSVTYPYLSGLFGRNDTSRMKLVVRLTIRYMTIAFVPLAVGAGAIAYPVLSLFGSGEYATGTLPLTTVLAFSAATLPAGIYANALLAHGKSNNILVGSLASLAANVGVSAALVGPLGIEGAALGLSSSSLAYFAVMIYYAKKADVLAFDFGAAWKSWSSSAIMGAVVIASEALLKGPIFIPVYVSLGAVTWLMIMKRLAPLNETDARLIENIMPKRGRGAVVRLLRFMGAYKRDDVTRSD